MGFFDFLKTFKRQSDSKKKPMSGTKKAKTSDKEGQKSGMEAKVQFDESTSSTARKTPASIVHKGNKYTFLAAYKFKAYALERQYVLRDNNVDSILKKVNTPEGVLYCIYTRKLTAKETTGKPKKRASTKKRKFVF